jgi:hypothetical protein
MIEETIKARAVPLSRPMVGAQFLKFCGKYDLVKLSENASNMADWMTASYPASAVTLYHLING